MKIKILQSIASATFSYRPKEVVELEDSLAQAWINCGTAEAIPETTSEAPKKKRGNK